MFQNKSFYILIFASLLVFKQVGACSLTPLAFKHQVEREKFINFVSEVEFSGDFKNGITMWNPGEDFPSLGLGHYIWYTKYSDRKFTESFPKMLLSLYHQGFDIFTLELVQNNIPYRTVSGKKTPIIIDDYIALLPAPWNSRIAFYSEPRRGVLNQQLSSPLLLSMQANYQLSAFNKEIQQLWKSYEASLRCPIAKLINSLGENIHGKVAMIDYINFKGNGMNPSERYKGQGWGLKQVLMMTLKEKEDFQIYDFINAAKKVLDRRIQNSPPARNEHRWRAGWFKRVERYADL